MRGAARPFFTLTLLLTYEFVSQCRRHDNRMIGKISFVSGKADTAHEFARRGKCCEMVFLYVLQ